MRSLRVHPKKYSRKKREFEDEETVEKKDKPKNFIPKKVRQLMKRKSKISKRILSSTKWWKNLEMEEELDAIESELDKEYSKKKVKEENIAIQKLKKKKNIFLQLRQEILQISKPNWPIFGERWQNCD